MKRPGLFLILLVTLAFGLGAWLQPRLPNAGGGRDADNVFTVLFGEGRRIFANHFAVKADVYLHSGFYPSIFDQAAKVKETEEQGTAAGHVHTAECHHGDEHDEHDGHAEASGHECDTSFMGEPKDWIERMGRNFMVSEHSHLEGGREREILPWLKLSAQLDPQRIESYLVAAYWLSERLDKPKDAEDFLRDGLRANPQSYEILFELGHLYEHDFKQPERARNVWKLALRRWDETEATKEKPDKNGRNLILGQLAELELKAGKISEAIRYFEEAKLYSPTPEALDARIKELRLRLALPDASVTPPAAH